MATFAQSLKREIARVARKELKDEIASLKRILTAHRSEIADLRKQIKASRIEIKRLARAKEGSSKSMTQADPKPVSETVRSRPGRQVIFTAERLKAQRTRLGLTQEQMGKLLGVSSLSVWKWESGSSAPRASRVPEILSQLSLGKRAALARVASAGQ